MHWRAAVKIAYDGRRFVGSQRQPGLTTVESEVISSLIQIGAIDSPETSSFGFASRTDRGVSALGNVFAFNTEFDKDRLLQALNAMSENVYYYAVAAVSDDFSPRHAKGRWYRYILPNNRYDEKLLKECAGLFEGKHDFLRFCKPDGKDTVKTIDKIEIIHNDNMLAIDIYSREFLRNMIRRIVAAIDDVAIGHSTISDVKSALNGEALTFGLANPEPLILMDVQYNFEFQKENTDALIKKLNAYEYDVQCRCAFINSLTSREHIIK